MNLQLCCNFHETELKFEDRDDISLVADGTLATCTKKLNHGKIGEEYTLSLTNENGIIGSLSYVIDRIGFEVPDSQKSDCSNLSSEGKYSADVQAMNVFGHLTRALINPQYIFSGI